MLKKIASISFLFLLLFNSFGYYLLLGYQQIENRHLAIEQMPMSSFKVIKILVSAYADIEDRDFEYLEGSFFHEGKAYNFVKKRIKNDSLELYCLNNVRQDQLMVQLNDYLHQNVINGKTSGNLPTKQMLKSFLKKYIINPILPPDFCSTKEKKTSSIVISDDEMPIIFLPPPFSPPDLV